MPIPLTFLWGIPDIDSVLGGTVVELRLILFGMVLGTVGMLVALLSYGLIRFPPSPFDASRFALWFAIGLVAIAGLTFVFAYAHVMLLNKES